MANIFLSPEKIISGEGALELSKAYLKKLGKKPLLVTDEMMIKIGATKKIEKILKDLKVDYKIFSGVNSEPTDSIINKGILEYKENNCDYIIALGGGSPIDAMKAIGAMITNEGNIVDYIGKEIENKPPTLVAIPTTAGTGSEATQFTIISDTKNNIKMLLKGSCLIPALAIVDPIFTVTVPKHITAATGIDALTHALEAYTSRKSNPMSDTFSISAIKRIYKNLAKAYENGEDIESRSEMAIASLEAGIAFNNSSVTIVHGMSRPIGALFHVPHGLSNAMLLEECIKFIAIGAKEKFVQLAKEIDVFEINMTEDEAVKAFIDAILKLLKALNIDTLEEFGVDKKTFINSIDKMTKDAIISGSPNNTRRIPSEEDIKEIYKKIIM